MAIGIAMFFSPLAPSLGFVPLPGVYFGWLVAILFHYACPIQYVKTWSFDAMDITDFESRSELLVGSLIMAGTNMEASTSNHQHRCRHLGLLFLAFHGAEAIGIGKVGRHGGQPFAQLL